MAKMNIKQLYDRYVGEKCGRSLFYKRIYAGMPLNEAIKPIKKENDIRSKLFFEELERYYKQPEPKPDKAKFYGRLFKGYSKEEAIKEELTPRVRKKKKPKQTPAYIPTYTREVIPNEDHSEIRIKYKKEEAEVIRRTYEKLIDDLERTIVEDETEAKSLQMKITELKKEYFIFKQYNE